jgi:hypothetical protein
MKSNVHVDCILLAAVCGDSAPGSESGNDNDGKGRAHRAVKKRGDIPGAAAVYRCRSSVAELKGSGMTDAASHFGNAAIFPMFFNIIRSGGWFGHDSDAKAADRKRIPRTTKKASRSDNTMLIQETCRTPRFTEEKICCRN